MEHAELDWEAAYVEPSKLTGYLLNLEHPKGKTKAAFFLRRGYDAATLEQHLLQIARSNPISNTEPNHPYGVKYTIRGVVESPSGRSTTLLTVWEVPTESTIPRFVTAHPDHNG